MSKDPFFNCFLRGQPSPVVPPRGDAELCTALLAVVALAPLGLLAEEVEEAVQELLRGDLKKKINLLLEIHVSLLVLPGS